MGKLGKQFAKKGGQPGLWHWAICDHSRNSTAHVLMFRPGP
jgi:hypothetical protein